MYSYMRLFSEQFQCTNCQFHLMGPFDIIYKVPFLKTETQESNEKVQREYSYQKMGIMQNIYKFFMSHCVVILQLVP